MEEKAIIVVGGGSAGMAAALAAREAGVEDVLVVERSPRLGGILRQCIHNGFGLHKFGEDLTGTEYALRYTERMESERVPYCTDTFVLDIAPDRVVTLMNPRRGMWKARAGAVVLAMGCRERARGSLLIPGTRPAGVFSAGTAQRYLNLEGYLPGKDVVILGSGDIGLIMARQLVLEGARVREVVEIMPYSSGLARNISQCLHDFDIPLTLGSTVVNIAGRGRVESVTVAAVDEYRRPVAGTERIIPCDTLLISAGLIPENELSREAGVALDGTTRGAVVDDSLETSLPGVFACGNVLHVHDMVDSVSVEGEAAGTGAARFVRGGAAAERGGCFSVAAGAGVSGVVPQLVRRHGENDEIPLMFRPKGVFRNCSVAVYFGGRRLTRKRHTVLVPGEMSDITVRRRELVDGDGPLTVSVED